MTALDTPKVWRTVFEHSIMVNNDEAVVHTSEPILPPWEFPKDSSYADYLRKFGIKPVLLTGKPPRWRVCRPVRPEEIEQGLDVTYRGPKDDEQAPKITGDLDALVTFTHEVENDLDRGVTPEKSVVYYLQYAFYDCLSGGCNRTVLAFIRYLIETYHFNLDVEVYPTSNPEILAQGRDYYNLQDRKSVV